MSLNSTFENGVKKDRKTGGGGIYILYTATSRKVVGKNVQATIPKGSMGYDQYIVPYTVLVEP